MSLVSSCEEKGLWGGGGQKRQKPRRVLMLTCFGIVLAIATDIAKTSQVVGWVKAPLNNVGPIC